MAVDDSSSTTAVLHFGSSSSEDEEGVYAVHIFKGNSYIPADIVIPLKDRVESDLYGKASY